jgi:transposase-like protein
MRLRSLFVLIMIIGVAIGTVSGELPDVEPVFEEQAGSGTVRKLTDREIILKMIRRRLFLTRMVMFALFLLAAKLSMSNAGLVETIQPKAVFLTVPLGAVLVPVLVFCICGIREVTIKGFQVIETEQEIIITYPGNIKLGLSKSQAYYDQMVDVEMVKLLLLRDPLGKKVFTQAEVGKLFGFSRQMTNRRIRLVEDTGDLVPLVKREYDKTVLSDEVVKRIAEIIADDWWKSDKDIAAQIISEGLTGKICSRAVNWALRNMDARFLRNSIRDRIKKGDLRAEMAQGYLIRRLFEIIEGLVEKEKIQPNQEYLDLQSLAAKLEENNPASGPRGKYRRNVEQLRLSTEKNRIRRKNVLEKAIVEDWDIYKERPVLCPDCLGPAVKLKQKRERKFKNRACRLEETIAEQYECKNPECLTKTFTRLPNELEPWAQADFFLKRQVFNLLFHVRGSLRRSVDHVGFENFTKGPAWTTALNWIRKAGREVVALESLFSIRWSGILGIDEKWVKIFDQWVYIYEAIDMKTGYSIIKRVFSECNKDNSRAVLLEIKALGYLPKVIVTDLITNYDEAVKDLFPNALHQRCLFHAEKAASKSIRKYLGEDCHEEIREQLRFLLRELFSAKTLVQVESQIKQFLWARSFFPKKLREFLIWSNVLQKISRTR